MIDRLPCEDPDSPAPGGDRPHNVASKKAGGARDCSQLAHDDRGAWMSAIGFDSAVAEADPCSGSPSNEARYMSRAFVRLILPEDVRGRALCETSTTEHFRPAADRITEATDARCAWRITGSGVRHCTRITTRSASPASTENATTSPRRTLSIWFSTANSRSSGHTLRPLTMMRSLLRPAMTMASPTR